MTGLVIGEVDVVVEGVDLVFSVVDKNVRRVP